MRRVWLLIAFVGAGLLGFMIACGNEDDRISDLASQGCSQYTPGWWSRNITGHKNQMKRCNKEQNCMWHFDSDGNNSCVPLESTFLKNTSYNNAVFINGGKIDETGKYDYLDSLCLRERENCDKSKNCKIFNDGLCKFDCGILTNGKEETDVCAKVDGCRLKEDGKTCEDTTERPKARQRQGHIAQAAAQAGLQRLQKQEADELRATCVDKNISECDNKKCQWDTGREKCQVNCEKISNSAVCKFLSSPVNEESGKNEGPCGYWGTSEERNCKTRDAINEWVITKSCVWMRRERRPTLKEITNNLLGGMSWREIAQLDMRKKSLGRTC